MNVRYCPKCSEYYGGGVFKLCEKCVYCNGELVELNIEKDDFNILYNISNDNNFLQAMIALKEKDLIEYQLKMAQFKMQIEQQEQIKKTEKENSKPHCPHCHSTNIKSISGLNRAGSIALWGIFSKKINKSFECLDCKYTW